MVENRTKRDPMPDSLDNIDRIIQFWDTHSTADYDDEMDDIFFEIDIQEEVYTVALVPELVDMVERQAKTRGVATETLVNLWVAEKLGVAA